MLFSCLNIVALFIAAHANRFMWYIWAMSSLLTGYLFSVSNLYGNLVVATCVGFTCVAAFATWSEDEEDNREQITWGAPILALLESFVIGVLLYIFCKNTFVSPIFECMGAGSMIVGVYLLYRKRVTAWIILIYSFLMYTISAAVTGNVKMAIVTVAQIIVVIYGLTRYMEYYEDNKLKESNK
jgi:hypothetical protein